MGQRIRTIIFLLGLCSLSLAEAAKPTTQPLVASLVPAATDLIVSIGAGDHLVGVSNYDDTSRPELKHLPKIGDYQTIDWERLRALKPQILIIFQSPERISPGVKERATKLNIKLVNIHTETLSDIFSELKNLGEILNEPEKAAAAAKKLDTQLQSMRQRLRNLAPVKTLLLRDETATGTVGRGTFLNDILELAGGQNVIEDTGWPTIDRERLASLNPDAIIVLLSNASPQVEKQAAANIQRMANLTAVKNNKVKILNLWYAQQPGLHLGDLADQFADFLHPEKAASNSVKQFHRGDAETQRGADSSVGCLCVHESPCFHDDARGCVRATWTVWLGCVGRAPEGQLAPRAPALSSLSPLPPSSPQLHLKKCLQSVTAGDVISPAFRGVAGGTYSAPIHLRIHLSIYPSASSIPRNSLPPLPPPTQLVEVPNLHSTKLL